MEIRLSLSCAQKAKTFAVAIRGVAGTQEQLDLIRDKVYAKNKHLGRGLSRAFNSCLTLAGFSRHLSNSGWTARAPCLR